MPVELVDKAEQASQLITKARKIIDAALKDPKLKGSPFRQGTVMAPLARIYHHLPPPIQDEIFTRLSPVFRRVREATDPQACWNAICRLGRDEDIHRALLYGSRPLEHTTTPEEQVYSDVGGWIGRYMEWAKLNEVHAGFHFWMAVACICASARNNYYMDWGTYRIYMNTYVLLSGKKGSGKTNALVDIAAEQMLPRVNHYIENPIYKLQFFPEDITQEALIEQLANLNNQNRIHVSDPYTGMAEIHTGDAAATIICDELSNLLGRSGFNIGKRVPFLVKVAFSGRYSKATVTGGTSEVENIALSLFGGTAPEWMRNTIVSDALSGGFLDRCAVVWRPEQRERAYARPEAIDPLEAEQLAQWLAKLAEPTEPVRKVIYLSPEAEAEHSKWYTELRLAPIRDLYDSSLHSLHRHNNLILKLAAVLSLSDETDEITREQWLKAKYFVEAERPWFETFMDIAKESQESEWYGTLKGWTLMNQGDDPNRGAPAGLAAQRYRRQHKAGTAGINRVFGELVESGELRRIPTGTRGCEYRVIKEED